jgi:hypothetical protein
VVVLKTLAFAGLVMLALWAFAVLYFGGSRVDSTAGLDRQPWFCWDPPGIPFPHRVEQPDLDHPCSDYEVANNPHP